MATSVTFNGATYSIPANREPRGWGTSLSAFLVDVANSSLSKAGGNFTLTADVNFGPDFGLVSKYVKYSSGTLTINTSGTITVPNATDTLVGKATTDTLTNKTLTSPVINTPTGIVKADVGLSNVDNTSDASKPVSTATQTELNLKAPIANPTFTGTVGGITATMVGLGNVDNTSNATERAATATLTNKTLTAPILDQAVFTEAAAPSTPASGKLAIYAKTDSKLYTKTSSGTEKQITTADEAFTNPMTTLGDTTYGAASGVATRLAGDTSNTKKWLRSLSSDGTAAAPSWAEVDQVKGQTSGSAVPAGYVGQVVTASLSNVTISPTATAVTVGTLTLTAGVWQIFGKSMWQAGGGALGTYYRVSISTSLAAEHLASATAVNAPAGQDFHVAALPRTISTTGQDVYLIGIGVYTSTAMATVAAQSTFYAVRIA